MVAALLLEPPSDVAEVRRGRALLKADAHPDDQVGLLHVVLHQVHHLVRRDKLPFAVVVHHHLEPHEAVHAVLRGLVAARRGRARDGTLRGKRGDVLVVYPPRLSALCAHELVDAPVHFDRATRRIRFRLPHVVLHPGNERRKAVDVERVVSGQPPRPPQGRDDLVALDRASPQCFPVDLYEKCLGFRFPLRVKRPREEQLAAGQLVLRLGSAVQAARRRERGHARRCRQA